MRLLALALLALVLLVGMAIAQSVLLPPLDTKALGTCNNLTARDTVANTDVPLGCIRTGRTFRAFGVSEKNSVTLDMGVAAGSLAKRHIIGTSPSAHASGNDKRVMGAVQAAGGDASATLVLPSGATLSRTAAARAADTLTVKDFGAKGDTVRLGGGAMSAGSAVFTSGRTFTAADVGKPILIRGAGASGVSLVTTVASVSGGTPTLAATATAAVSGAVYFLGTDDTASVTAALAYAATTRRCITFPVGGYWLASQSATMTLTNVCLSGEGVPGVGADYARNGATLLITASAVPVFDPGRGGAVTGLTVFYPAQDGATASPITYPALFEGNYVTGLQFSRSKVINAYQCLKITDGSAGLGVVRIDNVQAYCIDRAFWFLGGAPDVLQVSNSFFSPGVYEDIATIGGTANGNLGRYTAASGEFIRIDNGAASHPTVDGLQLTGSFVFGYRHGMRIVSGACNLCGWSGVGWDMVSSVLTIEGTGWAGLSWSGGYVTSLVYGSTTDDNPAIALSCTGQRTALMVTGVNFSQANGSWLEELNFCGRTQRFVGNQFGAFGMRGNNKQYYALGWIANLTSEVGATGNDITCLVTNTNSPVGIAIQARTALITGNSFSGSCAYPVTAVGGGNASYPAVYTFLGNRSRGTFGPYSIYDTAGAYATIYDLGNAWDKPSNKAHPFTAGGPMLDASGVRVALTSSGYTVPANVGLVRLTQTSTVASATITLPSTPADSQPVQIVQQGAGAVTALTFSPAVQGWSQGSSLAAGPGVGLRVRWDVTAAAWFREQ